MIPTKFRLRLIGYLISCRYLKGKTLNNQRQLFILTCAIFLLLSHSLPVYATQYNGCSDPQYISYVAKRIAFYEKLDRESYEKEKSAFKVPFENLSYIAKKSYLFSTTIASARFDTPQVALRHINAYQSSRHKCQHLRAAT